MSTCATWKWQDSKARRGCSGSRTTGPWNTVYRQGSHVAFIDWDAAQPIEPLIDLALAACRFVPLAPPHLLAEAGFDPPPDLPIRLRIFVAAYGLPNREAILPALQVCMKDEPELFRWLAEAMPDLAGALRHF